MDHEVIFDTTDIGRGNIGPGGCRIGDRGGGLMGWQEAEALRSRMWPELRLASRVVKDNLFVYAVEVWRRGRPRILVRTFDAARSYANDAPARTIKEEA
jgi:hypothetical protein